MNRITTLNLAKNRLESLKDLKIKIKTQSPIRHIKTNRWKKFRESIIEQSVVLNLLKILF